MSRYLILQAILIVSLIVSATSPAWSKDIAPDQDLSVLILVKSSEGKAVVRFGEGPLEMTTGGDRLGRNHAVVKEIIPGRMILDEIFTGKDGKPNRAEIILKDGEKGGTRILLRSDDLLPDDPLRRAIFPMRESEGE